MKRSSQHKGPQPESYLLPHQVAIVKRGAGHLDRLNFTSPSDYYAVDKKNRHKSTKKLVESLETNNSW